MGDHESKCVTPSQPLSRGRRASGVGRRRRVSSSSSGVVVVVVRRASGVARLARRASCMASSSSREVVVVCRRRDASASSSSSSASSRIVVVVLRRASYVDSLYGQFSLMRYGKSYAVRYTSECSSLKNLRKFLGSPKLRSLNFRKICFIIFLNFKKTYTPKIIRKFTLAAYIVNFISGASDIYVQKHQL